MKYLLDVNVLIALSLSDHDTHVRVVRWLKPTRSAGKVEVATCSIVELGFVRILTQPVYGRTIAEAKTLLHDIKGIPDLRFSFLADVRSVRELPAWVTKSGDVTDGHLANLAKQQGFSLATLDTGIPGVFLIPV